MFNIGGAVSTATDIGQGIWGHYQYNQGQDLLANNKRPVYNIPSEITDTGNLTMAQQMAMEGLPEEQKQQYLNNIQRSQQFGLNAMSDRKSGLSGLGSIVQSGNDASANLLAQDSGARMANQRTLMSVRDQYNQRLADYKDKAFNINQENPYYETQARGLALEGAGQKNFFGGMRQSGSDFSSIYGMGGGDKEAENVQTGG